MLFIETGAHFLRPTRVWRSVNDSKINVINEAQALGAQDSVSTMFMFLDTVYQLLTKHVLNTFLSRCTYCSIRRCDKAGNCLSGYPSLRSLGF